MAESQEDKAARQARLSKALSAAYLSHQITQLEDKVQGTQLSRRPNGHARGNGRPSADHGGRGRQRGGRGQGRATEGNRRSSQERGPTDRPQDKRDRWVLDTSALIFALPRIRSALKNYAELVVPLEVLKTLDLVKKSMHPISVKARQATRFIEDAQEKARAQARQDGTLDEHEPGQYRQGLWIQGDLEADNNLGWEPLAEIRADEGGPAVDDEDIQESAMPHYVGSTLQCASYFKHVWEMAEDAPILAICPEVQDLTSTEKQRISEKEEEEPHIVRFGDRARGLEIRQWAEIMGIGCFDLALVGDKDCRNKAHNVISQRDSTKPTGLLKGLPADKTNRTIMKRAEGAGVSSGRPIVAPKPEEPIRLQRPEKIEPQNMAMASAPASPKRTAATPVQGGLTGLTKEALERSQALLEEQEAQEEAKRRELGDMQRVRNEQRRQLDQSVPGLITRPGAAQASLLARPRGQDVQVRSSSASHGRAPAKLDKDGIKLLRPDPNQPVSILPRQNGRGGAKRVPNPPTKPAAQPAGSNPPISLLQRPK